MLPEGEYRLHCMYRGKSYYTENTLKFVEEVEGVEIFNLNYLSYMGNKFVIDEDTKEIELLMNINTWNAIIENVYGKIILMEPLFNNFRDLIEQKNVVIEEFDGQVLYDYNSYIQNNKDTKEKQQKILTTANDSTFFILTQELVSDIFNDGNRHYLQFKILPFNAKRLTPDIMNDPKFFQEITYNESLEFGFDRIWFNPNGYLLPPIQSSLGLFRLENNSAYKNQLYTNASGKPIFECSEDGLYIGYRSNGLGGVKSYILGNGIDGNLMEFVTLDFDRRFRPQTPNYDSCQSWFENKFYVEGQEKNPFWQVLNIISDYNVKSSQYIQKAAISKWQKNNNNMKLVIVPEEDKIASVVQCNSYTVDKNGFVSIMKRPYVDCLNGKLYFFLSEPAQKYQEISQFIETGIQVSNPYSKEKKDVFLNKVDCNAMINCSYTVNAIENLANPFDKEFSTIQLSEIALLDVDKKLIFYATFPPIEYRTDRHHVSFTIIVRNDNMVDYDGRAHIEGIQDFSPRNFGSEIT
jgi:hypothetical protein